MFLIAVFLDYLCYSIIKMIINVLKRHFNYVSQANESFVTFVHGLSSNKAAILSLAQDFVNLGN